MRSIAVIRSIMMAAVLAISASTVVSRAQEPIRTDVIADSGEGRLRSELHAAVKRPPLYGAWADVKKNPAGQLDVALIVDSKPDRQQSQVAEVTKIVEKTLGKGKATIKVAEALPFSEMLAAMQAAVKADSKLSAAQIDNAYFDRGGNDELFVHWIGSITIGPQGATASELLTKLAETGNQVLARVFEKSRAQVRLSKAEVARPEANQPGIVVVQSLSPVLDSTAEGRLRAELRRAVTRKPILQGAWAEVRTAPEGYLQIDVVADKRPDRQKLQVAEIAKIAEQITGTGRSNVTVVEALPFSEMLEDLQEVVETSPKLPGVRIDGACYYKEGSDELFVYPIGRITNSGRLNDVRETMNRIVNKHFGDSSKRVRGAKVEVEDPDSKRPGLIIGGSSEEAANRFYDLGINQYIHGEYGDAYRSFTKAHVENPGREDWQYWRVVCLIGMRDEGRAKLILRELLKAHRGPRSSGGEADVAKSLERVVGPIRQRLWELENSML